MKKNTLKRFMASAMTAVMCVSSLGTLAVNAAPADPAAETSVVDNLMSKMTLRQKIAQMMMPISVNGRQNRTRDRKISR